MNKGFTIIFFIGLLIGYIISSINTPQKENIESYTEGYLKGDCDGALYIIHKSYPNATCYAYISSGTKMDFGTTIDIDLSHNK